MSLKIETSKARLEQSREERGTQYKLDEQRAALPFVLPKLQIPGEDPVKRTGRTDRKMLPQHPSYNRSERVYDDLIKNFKEMIESDIRNKEENESPKNLTDHEKMVLLGYSHKNKFLDKA
jgi:hypothetical protein